MAVTTTTLASPVTVTDVAVVLTSATGVTAGCSLACDGENMRVINSYTSGTTVPVSRGRDGTATKAHPTKANVVIELPSDLAGPGIAAMVQWPNIRSRQIQSAAIAGAIPFPPQGSDLFFILDGTVAAAMTLAVPTTDMDGCFLWVASNGKAAHTVTVAGGIGAAGAGYTVATFIVGSQGCLSLAAVNGVWVLQGTLFSGTLTNILIALA
jgi:hypothetical protein